MAFGRAAQADAEVVAHPAPPGPHRAVLEQRVRRVIVSGRHLDHPAGQVDAGGGQESAGRLGPTQLTGPVAAQR